MTDKEIWVFIVSFAGTWGLLAYLAFCIDDIHRRLKKLQATLEEFIEDVQE